MLQIKYATLHFCFLKSTWGNDSDLVNPNGEFEILVFVCLFVFGMARSDIFTVVFVCVCFKSPSVENELYAEIHSHLPGT